MPHNRLLEYLEIVIDLEKHIYSQNKALAEITQTIDRLAISIPQFQPTEPGTGKIRTSFFTLLLLVFLCLFVVAAGAFLLFMGGSRSISELEALAPLFDFMLLPMLLACAVAGICAIIGQLIHNARYNSEIDDLWDIYLDQMEDYKTNLQCEESRIQQELLQKEFYEQALQALQSTAVKTQALLEKYYNLDVIYPKYHTLPMLVCLYDCFASGLCEELTGLNGAYRFLETELQFNRIPATAEELANRLEEIKDHHYMLYRTMNEANEQCELLLSATAQAAQLLAQQAVGSAPPEPSAILAYKQSRAWQELEYTNRMMGFYA